MLDDRHDGTNAVATLLVVEVVAEKSTSVNAEAERYILWRLLRMRSTISKQNGSKTLACIDDDERVVA